MAQFKVTQAAVDQLLQDVRREQIAIPELQRPFVWDSVKVRDLMDSLYKGFPVGYLITWQSIGARLKGGEIAAHQQILIDGQQRVTALRAAVAGLKVMNEKYKMVRIKIAFNPVTEEFATLTPILGRNPEWIADISELFNATSSFEFIKNYLNANPEAEESRVSGNLQKLLDIKTTQIGIISLDDSLDVETVAEIFIRINSKGVPLSSADFAMSKIATYGDRGRNLRKLIDYFGHLSVAPHVYENIRENDQDFAESGYLPQIEWLKLSSEDLYDPSYGDIIRVIGIVGFKRGKAASIVAELSGQDPETRKVDESRIPLAYDKLEDALKEYVNKFQFENFLMTIRSAGFISAGLISSKNAMNFAYGLYLRLRKDDTLSEGERKHIVRRWFVMSLLTHRSSASFESIWDLDINRIESLGAMAYLKQLEETELGDGFWRVTLPSELESSSSKNAAFQTFKAAQISANARGFLSKSISVSAMHDFSGDIHHIVPKDYLVKNGYPDRRDYNQVANYAFTETSINIRIGKKSPQEYMEVMDEQIESGKLMLGEIVDRDDLKHNFRENAVPENLAEITASNYKEFLIERRRLMADYIRNYYEQL